MAEGGRERYNCFDDNGIRRVFQIAIQLRDRHLYGRCVDDKHAVLSDGPEWTRLEQITIVTK